MNQETLPVHRIQELGTRVAETYAKLKTIKYNEASFEDLYPFTEEIASLYGQYRDVVEPIRFPDEQAVKNLKDLEKIVKDRLIEILFKEKGLEVPFLF